jgi:hypothetical protein
MHRRHAVRLLILGLNAAAWPLHAQEAALSLYGLALKDADLAVFLAAARAVGAVPSAGDPATLDTRAAGVPALERLTVTAHQGKVARVQFVVKAYGQDNLALRRLLLDKYGPPLTVSPRPLPFGGFGATAAPRGGFQWRFADGMALVYQHPALGDVTLSYVDEARMKAVAGEAAPPTDLRNRF